MNPDFRRPVFGSLRCDQKVSHQNRQALYEELFFVLQQINTTIKVIFVHRLTSRIDFDCIGILIREFKFYFLYFLESSLILSSASVKNTNVTQGPTK